MCCLFKFPAKKFPSQDDIDRISKVTSNAPINISVGHSSLGRKTIESLKEIERNRHLHLCQQGRLSDMMSYKSTSYWDFVRFTSDRTGKAEGLGIEAKGTGRSKN